MSANGIDQIPETLAGERVHAGGGFIQNQQIGAVDKGTAQPQLLFHTAGQLAGGTVPERQQPGSFKQPVNLILPGGASQTKQIGEEGDVLVHRQRMVEITAQSLGHIGNAGGDPVTKPLAAHIAAKHLQLAGLQLTGTGKQAQQCGFAHPVRADQPNHAARRKRQG